MTSITPKRENLPANTEEAITSQMEEAHLILAAAMPALANELVEIGLSPKVKPYVKVPAIAEAYKILQTGVIDRQNREKLESIRLALDQLENGTTREVIDV